MTYQEKRTIEKYYLKGSLTINGFFPMPFELSNILKGSLTVKHFDYANGYLNLSI